MRIMHSMAMLVALAMPSLIANSSASGAVVLPAGALENNTYWPRFQICTAENKKVVKVVKRIKNTEVKAL